MNPDIIQFQCSACQSVLTVPANLAGVSGPCPTCGQTVTSPAATPSFASSGFGASGFGGMQPQSQPQQSYEMPQVNQMPVQPIPGALGNPMQPTMNSGLLGGTAFPNAPQQQSPAAPSWQAPGLGQTMMGANQPLQSGFVPSSPAQPSFSGSLLPSQRAEGQMPMSGSLPQAPANSISWGAGLNPAAPAGFSHDPLGLPQRQAGQSSLIPGSSAPISGGFGDRSEPGSLMSQAIPSAPLGAVHGDSQQGAPPMPLQQPVHSGGRSRTMKKPKRGSNLAMIGLVVIFLGAVIAAAGWLFREPILQLAERFMPKSTPVDVAVVPQGQPAAPPIVDIVPSEPKSAESAPVVASVSFDPSEVAPAPLKAMPATTEEIAKATAPEGPPPMPGESNSTALATATKSGSLMEVPTVTGNTAVKQASLDGAVLTPAERGEITLDVPEEAKPAAEALQKFLAATTLEERLKYTLAVESMKPLMEQYYSDAKNSSGPISVDAIGLVRLDPKPQLGGGAHAVFGIESKTWKFAIPVMLEERGGSFKVDWLSFVEFKDRLLEKYLTTFQEGQVRYHVSMTRTHYFEDKVPNSSNKEAFRISPAPPNPFSATVFVDKDSALAKDLRDKIPWGAQVFAIIELEWMKLGDQAWVQMSAVPQLNWYSVPSAPKAVKASSSSLRMDASSEVPSETQKAVPIGR
jgi:hypothetical protein